MDRGNAWLDAGRLKEAAACYRSATLEAPTLADAHLNLGFALAELGRHEEACAPLQRATFLKPASSDAHYVLGTVYLKLGKPGLAIWHFEAAIASRPDFLLAYRDLARACSDAGLLVRAAEVLDRALEIDSAAADLHYFLGNVQAARMELPAAIASYRTALELQPGYAAVHANLALALSDFGDHAEALLESRTALALAPTQLSARSNLLLALSRSAACSASDYLAEARGFDEAAGGSAATLDPIAPRPAAGRSPDATLRVGFVSGDFRAHPVGFFLENVMAHWNRAEMTSFAYSNHRSRDALTARLESRFGHWTDITGMSDRAVLERVESDGIDVLIDLSGHTPYNRLSVFAQRAAPVQVTWLCYWASTGLRAMDYLLCDPHTVPEDASHQFTERAWRLPSTRLCFSPPQGAEHLAVSDTPALRKGHVTFGSFQGLAKVNDDVLNLWNRVLREVPGSHFRVQSLQLKSASMRKELLRRMTDIGFDESRVEFVEPMSRIDYLASHAEVDILLDTFPHGGGTTTCEALWMGVPTVTRTGPTMLSRQSAGMLTCVGLRGWVAESDDDYVACASAHAGDLQALDALRSQLRSLVLRSPLCDAAAFADELQRALRAMWRDKIQTHARGAECS